MNPLRKLFLGLLAAALTYPALLAAGKPATEKEIAARFRPFRIEQVALAPDGRHLAYTAKEGALLFLIIVDVDHPETRAVVPIGADDDRDPKLRGFKTMVIFNGMIWASSSRLVYAASVPGNNHAGEVVRAVDADGRNHRLLADGEKLGGVPHLLGLRSREPNTVTVEVSGQIRSAATDTDLSVVKANVRTEGEPPPNISLPKDVPEPPPSLTDSPDPADLLNESGERSTLYAIEVNTGKAKVLSAERSDGSYLYDQQGHARIMETAAFSVRAPIDPARAARSSAGSRLSVDMSMISLEEIMAFQDQTFRYRAIGAKRWQDLDEYLGAKDAFVFRTSVEIHWAARSFPVAFDTDPNILYFASNIGRDTYGLYALDLRTKQRTEFAVEDPAFDLVGPSDAMSEKALVFDRQRRLVGVRLTGLQPRMRWVDRELAQRQVMFETKFPGRNVEILDWDDARQRLVARVSTLSDPGRYFVFDEKKPGGFTEFFRTAPWMNAETVNTTMPFAFDTPGGVHLTGTITLPRAPRISPPPLVMVCEDILAAPVGGFDRNGQALADLGFVVAQVNYRGTLGLGARHRDSVATNLDLIPAEDVRAAAGWVAAHYPVNPKIVALFGEELGGYVAMRTLQLYPDFFRCVVAVDAPATPRQWVEGTFESTRYPTYEEKVRRRLFDNAALARSGKPALAESLTKPLLFVQDEKKDNLASTTGKGLTDRLHQRGVVAEYLAAQVGFAQGDPDARAKAFSRISDFLFERVYNFGVEIGPTKEVK